MSKKNIFTDIKKLHNRLNGSTIEYDLGIYKPIVNKINEFSLQLKSESDAILQNRSLDLKKRINTENNDTIIIESFALVKETIYRILGIEPFDEQITGGIALYKGRLAEMQTGEGKTLTAVFPSFTHALTGKGVHILTFNDYLARRDAQWMGPVFDFLGVKTACVQEGMSISDRKAAYKADITYLTAKEAGFDFLRDSMCYDINSTVHQPLSYAIVDEADSILIDEARVPLVIAGSAEKSRFDSTKVSALIRDFHENEDYEFDEYKRNVMLTEHGIHKIETTFSCGNLYDENNGELLSKIHYSLHAHFLLQNNKDYIIKNGRVELVDEFTGRVADKRRWPDGLHEAVEVKEGCETGLKGRILNTITLQHFLMQYPQISGMTATAQVAEEEFKEFYNLHITVIPPHKPCIRNDLEDLLIRTKKEKLDALITEIVNIHCTGQPILVGTQSVEESIQLAEALRKVNITCVTLNAKNDEYEASIIARAGRKGAVTISTNMAGRGTDIRLGGNDLKEASHIATLGGLYVIGTNRYESRRIDNQLRGRAARQGDPGKSRFFISLEDDIFIKYNLKELLPKIPDDLKSTTVTQEIDRIQRIVEGQNLEIKIDLCKYSNILEQQRQIIHEKRIQFLKEDISLDFFSDYSETKFNELQSILSPHDLLETCRYVSLLSIDNCWSSYLTEVDDLKSCIHLRRVGGQDPLFEFRKITIQMFDKLDTIIQTDMVDSFNKLCFRDGKIDFKAAGLKTPSATWTYLVNDDPFEKKFGMQLVANVGFNAAAGLLWPLTMLLLLIKKLTRKAV